MGIVVANQKMLSNNIHSPVAPGTPLVVVFEPQILPNMDGTVTKLTLSLDSVSCSSVPIR